MRSLIVAREKKETEVETDLFSMLRATLEKGDPVEFRLELSPTKLAVAKDTRIFATKEAPRPKPKATAVRKEWDADSLAKHCETFYDRLAA